MLTNTALAAMVPRALHILRIPRARCLRTPSSWVGLRRRPRRPILLPSLLLLLLVLGAVAGDRDVENEETAEQELFGVLQPDDPRDSHSAEVVESPHTVEDASFLGYRGPFRKGARRQGATLAPDGRGTSFLQSSTKTLLRSQYRLRAHAAGAHQTVAEMIPGVGMGGMGRTMLQFMALFAVIAIAYKMIVAACASKKADCRRCKPCARGLLFIGYDEFEGFDLVSTVHSIQDVKKDNMTGAKEFKVTISCSWSKFETRGTKDMKWEQTKSFPVPQGASTCDVSLYSLGKIKDTKLATTSLRVLEDMIQMEGFWGKKTKLKLESKGKLVGSLFVTFRKKGDDNDAEAGGMMDLPIAGVSDESPLAFEIAKEWEELCNTPGYVKPEGNQKLEGDAMLHLLSKVLSDDLREVNEKGKDQGKIFIRVIQCNFAEFAEDRKEELERQMKKAKKKGLTTVEKKWYWCWYEDKKSAEKDWKKPDGFMPLASISNVFVAPERGDEFVIKYAADGDKEFLRYRRESGKGLEVWVEGLELAFQACRTAVKKAKADASKEETALKQMNAMHWQYVQTHGMPQDQAQWSAWKDHFKAKNYDEDLVAKLWQQLYKQQQAQQKKKAKGKAK